LSGLAIEDTVKANMPGATANNTIVFFMALLQSGKQSGNCANVPSAAARVGFHISKQIWARRRWAYYQLPACDEGQGLFLTQGHFGPDFGHERLWIRA
jgi:hypothetical protein